MEFGVLGALRARLAGGWVELTSAKQRAILGILLVHANRPVSADLILDEVWGAEKVGAGTLRYHVSQLRDLLEPERERGEGSIIETAPAGYVLRVRPGDVDADRFEQMLTDGLGLADDGRIVDARSMFDDALALWRGDAYEELRSERFTHGEIARLDAARTLCLERRIAADLELGHHREVAGELEQLTIEYPLHEAFWEHRMVALYRTGRPADALRAYASARRLLGEELGIEPGFALRDLERKILLHELPGATPTQDRANIRLLPVRMDSFIGRVDDVRTVAKLVEEHRLVTMTGVGGVGKTSLAIEVARHAAAEEFGDVVLVELGPLRHGAPVVNQLAATLGIDEHPTRPTRDVVVEALSHRTMLLVVDNCEHVLDDTGSLVDELLTACHDLRILATSREPLGLRGEQVWQLAPLRLPDEVEATSLAGAQASDAVRMFLERAAEADSQFVLDADNLGDIVALCRRLDGIPLALELAAARIRVLSPAEIVDRLDDRFALLAVDRNDTPARHRSLRAAIEWSHDLLGEVERTLFRRLAVFPGGFDLDAAEAICSGDRIERDQILGALQRLVDACLVEVTSREPRRFGVLESIGEFARRELVRAHEVETTRQRCADHFIGLVAFEPAYGTSEFEGALGVLEHDLPNYRSALIWALEVGDSDRALALGARMRLAWSEFAMKSETLALMPRVLDASRSSVAPERVWVMITLGHSLAYSAERDRLPPLIDEAEDLAKRLGDPALTANARLLRCAFLDADSQPAASLGHMRAMVDAVRALDDPRLSLYLCMAAMGSILIGELEDARTALDEADRRARHLDQPMLVASVDGFRGMLAHYEGDLDLAERLLLTAVRELRRRRLVQAQAGHIRELAQVALAHNELDRADQWSESLIDCGQRMHIGRDMAEGRVLLARAALARSDLAAATEHVSEALSISIAIDDAWALSLIAATAGQIAFARQEPDGAAIAHGAAEALRRRVGLALPACRRRELEHEWGLLGSAVGGTQFKEACRHGAELQPSDVPDIVRRALFATAT